MCLTPKQLEALEFQTTQGYEALKRALETREFQDAIYAENMFSPYVGAHYSPLSVSIRTAVDIGYMSWKRGRPRADIMDRYLLQLALGSSLTDELVTVIDYEQKDGKCWKFKATKVTEEELKANIDGKTVSYEHLAYLAKQLSEAGHFNPIMNLIDYVRENYPQQSGVILTFVVE